MCVNTQLNGIHQRLFILEGCTRNYISNTSQQGVWSLLTRKPSRSRKVTRSLIVASSHYTRSDYNDLVAVFYGFVSAFFLLWPQIILTRPLTPKNGPCALGISHPHAIVNVEINFPLLFFFISYLEGRVYLKLILLCLLSIFSQCKE